MVSVIGEDGIGGCGPCWDGGPEELPSQPL